MKILKSLQDRLFFDSEEPIDAIPNMSVGGWGGWKYAVGSSLTLQNSMGEMITIYCIFDSDYHTREEIEARYTEAKKQGVQLCVWSRKEIENYSLVPSPISRLIRNQLAPRIPVPSPQMIRKKMETIARNMENEGFDALSAELLARDRKLGAGGANKLAREIMRKKKAEPNGLLNFVSGKAIISRLAEWTQSRFGVHLTARAIAKEMRADEIPQELVNVVSAIERCAPLTSSHYLRYEY